MTPASERAANEDTRWGVPWGLRIFAGMGVVVMLTIGSLLAFQGERTGDRIGGWVFLVIVPTGTWLFVIRPHVDLTATALVVRNPVRSHYIRLQDIKAAHPLNTGLALEVRDGREVVAWALQQGLLMTVLRSNTRSDKASDAILAAARAARAGDTTR